MLKKMKRKWRVIVLTSWLAVCSGALKAQAENPGCIGDLDNNMQVDLDDLMTLLTLYGSACTVTDDPADHEPTQGRVAISEIMYNPSSAQGNDSEYEFLELHNLDTFSVNLSGWVLDNAVAMTFPEGTMLPPNGFVAVVRDLDVMLPLVPPTAICIQWNSGESLNNTGETIELWRADGSLSDAVSYEDDDGWVGQPDGGGPSLEWFDTGLDNDFADAWTFSAQIGGTPGAANSMWGLSDPE